VTPEAVAALVTNTPRRKTCATHSNTLRLKDSEDKTRDKEGCHKYLCEFWEQQCQSTTTLTATGSKTHCKLHMRLSKTFSEEEVHL